MSRTGSATGKSASNKRKIAENDGGGEGENVKVPSPARLAEIHGGKKAADLFAQQDRELYGDHPPVPDTGGPFKGYFCYRQGRVRRTQRVFNTFLFLLAIVFLCLDSTTDLMRAGLRAIGSDSVDWGSKLHVACIVAAGACMTMVAYYSMCASVEKKYYESEEMREQSADWKIKPNMWLTADLRRQEMIYGCANAAVGSVCGMLIFAHQMHPNTAPGTVKIYYRLQEELYGRLTQPLNGWLWVFASSLLFFLISDLWAYVSHRILHLPFFYQTFHKIHHRYRAVSPFGAWAMHWFDFVFIVGGFQLIVYLLPIHVGALIVQLLYVAVLAVKDHSGIDYEGWFVWSASAAYHDDHHTHFHCNLGQSLFIWDWLGGTLRRRQQEYGERNYLY